MNKVIFKHPEQECIYPKLLNAVNLMCNAYKKDAECVAGYRDRKCQEATNKQVLLTRKGSYQTEDGSVYTGTGENRKCWASAYGKSNHCFCIAMDFDGWIENLTNAQLKPYGLIKPIEHEPWHVTLIELVGISETEKIKIRDSVLNAPVDELKQALEFICPKAGINYDTWYRVAKTVKWLDVAFIKIWKAWRDGK